MILFHQAFPYRIFMYKQKSKKVLIIVNSTEEDFATTDLRLHNLQFSKIVAIDRKSGKRKRVSYTQQGDKTVISTPNQHLTTQTFILYE